MLFQNKIVIIAASYIYILIINVSYTNNVANHKGPTSEAAN